MDFSNILVYEGKVATLMREIKIKITKVTPGENGYIKLGK